MVSGLVALIFLIIAVALIIFLTSTVKMNAFGAGAMTVSHANDSFFWVVSQFSDMKVSTAYRAYTSSTLVLGVVSIIAVAILTIFVH